MNLARNLVDGFANTDLSFQQALLATGEVMGRAVFRDGRFSSVRQRINKWVRRPSTQATSASKPVISLHELRDSLVALGVGRGDVLMVHSAWDGMRHLEAKPSAVVSMLLELVGGDGTLLMPTSPIKIKSGDRMVLDLDRSPSMYGILTEAFRRTPGTLRSPIPAATVSAKGRLAAHFTRDFYELSAHTHYGVGSPWWELGVQNAKVLVLGIEFIRPLTMTHCVFDVLGADGPFADFHYEAPLTFLRNGVEETRMMRWQRADAENYGATVTFARLIVENGFAQVRSPKGLKVALVDAKRFLDWHLDVARRFGLPYWLFPRARRVAGR